MPEQSDKVTGMLSISVPVGDSKFAPWVKIESGFEVTAKTNTQKSREEANDEAWKEIDRRINKSIKESVLPAIRQILNNDEKESK